MRILGVLDLMNGVVVRGVGGRRAEYRPLTSPLCPISEPLAVAEAFRREYGVDELYVADLDAIAGATPTFAVSESLRHAGFRVWVDAGVREAAEARAIGDVVVGLETVASLDVVAALASELGERMVFSLDLRGGVALRDWGTPREIAEQVIARGVRRLLVLDLARVGAASGTGTEAMCGELVQAYPHLEIGAGGGVRGRADLLRLHASGVSAVLLASALHQRDVTRADLDVLRAAKKSIVNKRDHVD